MFPAPSPNSQALFAQLASGGATPNTIDFHRTAMSAAAKRDREQANGTQQQQSNQAQSGQQNSSQQQQPASQQPSKQQQGQAQQAASQPQAMSNGASAVKAEPRSGPFDPHDNDAANGLFMLAQGRNGAQNPNQFKAPAGAGAQHHNTNTSPQISNVNGGGSAASGRGISEMSNGTDDSDHGKPNGRGKPKKMNSTISATNGRRKADELPMKMPPAKKSRTITMDSMPDDMDMSDDDDDDDDMMKREDGTKTKMTDEEKRKNFLERNR